MILTLQRSLFAHQAGIGLCRVTYARGWMRMYVEFWDEILLRGGECKTRENSNFLKNGKMVISVKFEFF